MLKIEFKRPDLIDFSSINFSVKPKLCAALGIIDQRTSNLCLKINKIRNSLAHHLNSDINQSALDDLLNEYHPNFRKSFIEDIEKEFKKSIAESNPTSIIARLVKDFVGLLQGMRRDYEIRTQKRDIAFKVIRDAAAACRCGETLESRKESKVLSENGS